MKRLFLALLLILASPTIVQASTMVDAFTGEIYENVDDALSNNVIQADDDYQSPELEQPEESITEDTPESVTESTSESIVESTPQSVTESTPESISTSVEDGIIKGNQIYATSEELTEDEDSKEGYMGLLLRLVVSITVSVVIALVLKHV